MTSIIGASRERRKKKSRRDFHWKKNCRKSTKEGANNFPVMERTGDGFFGEKLRRKKGNIYVNDGEIYVFSQRE